jgi:chemotaxis protein CheX
MLGADCERYTGPVEIAESESVTAMVGIGRLLSGVCVFRCSASAAIKIAERVTGAEFEAINDTVKDAVGEICCMITDSWEKKALDLATTCSVPIPAVITGRDFNIHVQASDLKICRTFMFTFDSDETRFTVTIICNGLS